MQHATTPGLAAVSTGPSSAKRTDRSPEYAEPSPCLCPPREVFSLAPAVQARSDAFALPAALAHRLCGVALVTPKIPHLVVRLGLASCRLSGLLLAVCLSVCLLLRALCAVRSTHVPYAFSCLPRLYAVNRSLYDLAQSSLL